MLKFFHVNKQRTIAYNNFTLHLDKKTIISNGITTHLTDIEVKILSLLTQEHTKTFSKEEILACAWNSTDNYTSVVPQAISLLRKKLHKHHIDAIETVKGKGYKATKKCDTSNINKKTLFKLIIIMGLSISIGYILSIIAENKDLTPENQYLIESLPNVYTPSNSLPIKFDHSELKDNVAYYINRQSRNLSISACLQKGNFCKAVYNKVYFTNSENTHVDINSFLKEVTFKYEPPKLLVAHQEDSEFKVESSICFAALDNPEYSGHAYMYYDIKTESTTKLLSELSIYITESGYEGGYSFSSDLIIKLDKQDSKYTALLNNINEERNFKVGRKHFGIIKDQTQLYAYPRLLNGPVKQFFAHIYPINKNTNFTYFEDTSISILMFEHK